MGRGRRAHARGRRTRARFDEHQAVALVKGAVGTAGNFIRQHLDPTAPSNQVANIVAAPIAAGGAGYALGAATRPDGPPDLPRRARPSPGAFAAGGAARNLNRMPGYAAPRRRGRRAPRRGRYRRRSGRGRFRSYSKRKAVGKGRINQRKMTRSKRFKPSLKISKRFRAGVKKVIATSAPQIVKFFKMQQAPGLNPSFPMSALISTADDCFQPQRPDSCLYPAGSTSSFVSGMARRDATSTQGMMFFPFNHVRRADSIAELAGAYPAADPGPPPTQDPRAYFRGNYYHPTYCAVRCGWLPGENRDAPGKTAIPSVSRVEHGFGYIKNMKKLVAVCTAYFGGFDEAKMRQALFTVLGTKGKRDQLCMISGTGWTQKMIDLRNVPSVVDQELAYRNIKALNSCFVITKRVYTEMRPQVTVSPTAESGVAAVASGKRGEGALFAKTQYKFKLPSKHTICADANVGDNDWPNINTAPDTPTDVFIRPSIRTWVPFIFCRGDSLNAQQTAPYDNPLYKNMVAGGPVGTATAEEQATLPSFYCDYKVGIRDEMEE